jgi:hypothetical protein
MYTFLKSLTAAFLAVALAFTASAFAQDKKDEKGGHADKGHAEKDHADKKMDCAYCQAVSDVAHNMRCDSCKTADAQCDHCKKMGEKLMASASCPACKEMAAKGHEGATKPAAACADCANAMKEVKDGHCQFCAEKAMVMHHAYCCKDCAAKGEKAAESCTKCEEMRKAIGAAKCPTCDGKKS